MERTLQLRDCRMRCLGWGEKMLIYREKQSTKGGRACVRGKTVSSVTTWKFVILCKWEHQVAKPRWKQFGKLVLLDSLFQSIKCKLTADPRNYISRCSYSREIQIDLQTHDFGRIAHSSNILNTQKQKLLRAIKKQCWVGNQDTLTQLWLSFLKIILLFSMCVHAHVYIFGCLQKLEASGLLEPKLQKVVIHLTQVRRTKLGFFARAANVLTTMPSLQLPISLSYVWYLWGLSRNSYFHPRDVPRIKQS